MLHALGMPPGTPVFEVRGCAACSDTGYSGRTGIYELLVVDEAVRRVVHEGGDEPALREAFAAQGAPVLRADGARWLAAGSTSLAELLRVTRD